MVCFCTVFCHGRFIWLSEAYIAACCLHLASLVYLICSTDIFCIYTECNLCLARLSQIIFHQLHHVGTFLGRPLYCNVILNKQFSDLSEVDCMNGLMALPDGLLWVFGVSFGWRVQWTSIVLYPICWKIFLSIVFHHLDWVTDGLGSGS